MQDDACKPVIAHKKVAPPSKNKQRKAFPLGKAHSLNHVLFCSGGAEPQGGTTDTEGRIRRESDLWKKLHRV